MARPTRTQIEDGVVALLADLVTTRVVDTVRPHNGEMGAERVDDILRGLGGRVPGVLVATEAAKFEGMQVQRRLVRRTIDVALYLVSGAQSTREDRTRRDIYAILDATLERLTGALLAADPGVELGHLAPVSEEVMHHDDRLCVWRQVWQLSVEAELAARPAPAVAEVGGRVRLDEDGDGALGLTLEASTT